MIVSLSSQEMNTLRERNPLDSTYDWVRVTPLSRGIYITSNFNYVEYPKAAENTLGTLFSNESFMKLKVRKKWLAKKIESSLAGDTESLTLLDALEDTLRTEHKLAFVTDNLLETRDKLVKCYDKYPEDFIILVTYLNNFEERWLCKDYLYYGMNKPYYKYIEAVGVKDSDPPSYFMEIVRINHT